MMKPADGREGIKKWIVEAVKIAGANPCPPTVLGIGIGGNFEITQNWEADTTVVWFNPTISAVTSLGTQKTQFSIGPRFNLAAPSGTKADLGVRAVVVFLFPK